MKEWLPILIVAIRNWNSTFNMNYFEFRERMKEISMRNLNKVKGATIINKSEIKALDDEKEEFVIYPTDDDDWVIEDLFGIACSELEECDDVVVWPFGFFRGDRIMVTDIEKPVDNIRWTYSNNAIITRKGYERLRDSRLGCEFLEDHRQVDECCVADNCVVKVVHKALSAYNHSPASATRLWGLSASNKSRGSASSLLSSYGQLPKIPEEIGWSVPYAEEMWKLITELRQRKVFL